MTVHLEGEPYLIVYEITTGLHPMLVEISANSDGDASRQFKKYKSENHAKLYKLLQDNDRM